MDSFTSFFTAFDPLQSTHHSLGTTFASTDELGDDSEQVEVDMQRLMSEVNDRSNTNSNVMTEFEMRRSMYLTQTVMQDVETDSNDSMVDQETSQRCQEIERTMSEARVLLSNHMNVLLKNTERVTSITRQKQSLTKQLAIVKRAIHDFECACMQHDKSSDVMEPIECAVKTLVAVHDSVNQSMSAQLPEIHSEMARSKEVLMKLSSSYRALRASSHVFTCPICLDRQVEKFLIPCGHTFCAQCCHRVEVNACPMCRVSYSTIGDLYYT